MPRKTNYQLSKTELSQLKEAIRKDPRPEVRQRASAIHMLHLGYKPEEVGEQLMVSKPSIYNWHRRYREDNLDGLANQPKGRPKRKADEAYCQALEAALDQDPSELGYPFSVWSVERLRDHLERAGRSGARAQARAARQAVPLRSSRRRGHYDNQADRLLPGLIRLARVKYPYETSNCP